MGRKLISNSTLGASESENSRLREFGNFKIVHTMYNIFSYLVCFLLLIRPRRRWSLGG
jgi:hypothetical protein